MIDKPELDLILSYIIEYWNNLRNNPDDESMKPLPSKFWMKSLGGPVGNKEKQKGRCQITAPSNKMQPLQLQSSKKFTPRGQDKGLNTLS